MSKYLAYLLAISFLFLTACTSQHKKIESVQHAEVLADAYVHSAETVELITSPLAFYCRYERWPSHKELKNILGASYATYQNILLIIQEDYIIRYRLSGQPWMLKIAKPEFQKGKIFDAPVSLQNLISPVVQNFTMPVECSQQEIIFY